MTSARNLIAAMDIEEFVVVLGIEAAEMAGLNEMTDEDAFWTFVLECITEAMEWAASDLALALG